MEFGITFKGDIDPKRTVNLARMAEQAGFSYAWFFDSHVLWRECYVTMAMCMEHTTDMRFGPCVTNPGVRDWSVAASLFGTLALQSGGRFDMGVGRGDSSRRVLGRKPETVETMVAFADSVKRMIRGESVKYSEDYAEVQFPWTNGYELPVWIAAYGPKALAAAGEHANGLIIQLADPWLVKWFADQAVDAGKAAGRDMSGFRVLSAAPVWVGDMKKAREQTRWFPAMVGNHVADLVERYGREGGSVPKRLTDYIEGRKGYDYRHHADKDADHLGFIKEDIIDSFGILGEVDQHLEKLKELESLGVTQFNIYLMCGDEERMVEEYGKHILPQFRAVSS
ncbi:MAG: TIGR03842 family LLM class F420-dependent oxidoreductase [Anaerolineae bacterium]|nr:TIGR03842 family LLM class F420-dependent oxidoreductase [Anaerolineae bacterium]NUQ04225.1 TIGR03842 family LLM class F420-dependent oxidoreductase [Anaerolineae bacterium]